MVRNTRRCFKIIYEAVNVSQEEMNKPLTRSEIDPVLGLRNPYSKATCIILQLYSMEIGTPQLFAEVNRVARELDYNYLFELGPFLKAVS